MPNLPQEHRFSQAQKRAIIAQASSSRTITLVCQQNHISRTIFYRWLKAYGLPTKEKKSQQREVVETLVRHPQYSVAFVARMYGLSRSRLQALLHQHNLQTAALRRRRFALYGRKLRRVLSVPERLVLIRAFETGEKVSSICQKAHISRTIFYKWLKMYRQRGTINEKSVKSLTPQTVLAGQILATAQAYPAYSLAKLYQTFLATTRHHISRATFYSTLRQLNLNTISLRQALVGNQVQISKLQSELITIIDTTKSTSSVQPKPIQKSLHKPTRWDSYRFSFMSFVIVILGLVSLLTVVVGSAQLAPHLAKLNTYFSGQFEQGRIGMEPTPTPPAISPKATALLFPPFQKLQQDLSWGVLAMNTNKSIYAPGEAMQFGFGVLDPQGRTICDAKLTLTVTVPSEGKQYKLSTDDGQIASSGQCRLISVTNLPDYTALFRAKEKEETYLLRLEAETAYGKRIVEENVRIAAASPFEIVRTSVPTRIYPGGQYVMRFTVLAKQDFSGDVREEIPASFTVGSVTHGGRVDPALGDSAHTLVWPVSLQAGQTMTFSYAVTFPPESPEAYLLGPIRLSNPQGKIVYQEFKPWQIAADAYLK